MAIPIHIPIGTKQEVVAHAAVWKRNAVVPLPCPHCGTYQEAMARLGAHLGTIRQSP